MAIIALSGKAQSGKDTVGKIIQTLTNFPTLTNEQVIGFLNKETYNNKFQIKKFADKLKEIVCILLGCTREQLENEEFKSKPLGEEWNCYLDGFTNILYLNEDDAIHEAVTEWDADETFLEHRIMTPRLLLQLLGTECGRQIIHPNIWVNSLMSEYKIPDIARIKMRRKGFDIGINYYMPNWIITDMRFPNELEAVEKRGGLSIRVNRNPYKWIEVKHVEAITGNKAEVILEHESETALDNAEFDYTIDNNGTLEELIDKVREILTKEKFI